MNISINRDDLAISTLYSIVEARAHPEKPPRKRKISKSSSHSSFSSQSGVETVSDVPDEILRDLDDYIKFGK